MAHTYPSPRTLYKPQPRAFSTRFPGISRLRAWHSQRESSCKDLPARSLGWWSAMEAQLSASVRTPARTAAAWRAWC
jgi:hypothetical protein